MPAITEASVGSILIDTPKGRYAKTKGANHSASQVDFDSVFFQIPYQYLILKNAKFETGAGNNKFWIHSAQGADSI